VKDYHINIFYSEEDGGYIADIPDLEACSAFGTTAEEALTEPSAKAGFIFNFAKFVEWPADKKTIDIGDFYADWRLIADTLGWRPHTTLADGLRETIAFYREHFAHYVPAADGTAAR